MPFSYIKVVVIASLGFAYFDYKRRFILESLLYWEYENMYGNWDLKMNRQRLEEEGNILGAMEFLKQIR